jgi:hypothetical protein
VLVQQRKHNVIHRLDQTVPRPLKLGSMAGEELEGIVVAWQQDAARRYGLGQPHQPPVLHPLPRPKVDEGGAVTRCTHRVVTDPKRDNRYTRAVKAARNRYGNWAATENDGRYERWLRHGRNSSTDMSLAEQAV